MEDLDKRIWKNIDDLMECADLKGETEEDDYQKYLERINVTAMLGVSLGLGLEDLGNLALYFKELEEMVQEPELVKNNLHLNFKAPTNH